MSAQVRIAEPGNLLRRDGTLARAGYSTGSVLTYNREAIRAPWRIKEWDFYQFGNARFCIQMTIGHVSYAGTISVTAFDLRTGKKHVASRMLALPFGSLRMPRSAEEGDLSFRAKGFEMDFLHVEGGRRLLCRVVESSVPVVEIDVLLAQSSPASIVMATPFDGDPQAFYYNHKICGMPVTGTARFAEDTYDIDPSDTFGLLDWGRGVWPFRHEWFWSSGSGLVDGKVFGFNLGYGFGNTAAATENMLFHDGTCHKLGDVSFGIDDAHLMRPWTFTSGDGRFEMVFTPVYDNDQITKLLFVDNRCHQVFGNFTGRAVLDDGTALEIRDLPAFAEHAVNRW